MTRLATAVLSVAALGGASAVEHISNYVEYGGQTWEQPSGATFYIDPSTPGWHTPAPGTLPQKRATCADQMHKAARLLRSVAWHLEHPSKKSDIPAMENTLTIALELLHNNEKRGPQDDDCRGDGVPD